MDRDRPTGGHKVSAVDFVDVAHYWVRALEDREVRRGAPDLEEARKIVARHTGVPTGRLRSLRKKRIKEPGVSVFSRLNAAIIRALESELTHVQHELQIARQTGLDPASSDFQSALTNEARLREALGLDASEGWGGLTAPPASKGGAG